MAASIRSLSAACSGATAPLPGRRPCVAATCLLLDSVIVARVRRAWLSSLLPQKRSMHTFERAVSRRNASAETRTANAILHRPTRGIWSASVVGKEPGISASPTSSDQAQLHDDSEIRIVDFASDNVLQHNVRGNELEAFLKENSKPDWAACRWIYVNGLNQATVQCLGRSKGLHHLALEDVLEKGTPVKADWYDSHCFMVLALQKLERIPETRAQNHPDAETARTFRNSSHQNRVHGRANAKIYHFQQQPFAMDIEQCFMFLTTDNTVITIFERSGGDVFAPIMRRLESPQTVMRSSNDPSMLVQGIIDTVVDLSIPIGKAVGDAFAELEEAVLTQPAISQSKQLYVLRSGLTILMDNISANGSVVRELISHRSVGENTEPTSGMSVKRKGGVVISPMAQVYLQDVQDHIRTLSNSTHMSIRSAENLTSLIFNTIAASQNESVRQLTVISCFFLPLTFLTGYFGKSRHLEDHAARTLESAMVVPILSSNWNAIDVFAGMNFDPMPVVNEHSDAFFWWIASPMIVGMALILLSRTMWVRSRALKQRRRRG